MKIWTRSLSLCLRGALLVTVCAAFSSCTEDVRTDGWSTWDTYEFLPLSDQQKAVIETMPVNAIIAHRGTEFWAPEESEIAMRWARNIGAEYLEIDLQRTKDKVLLALHDDNLKRTTDINQLFPNQADLGISNFTWKQALTFDIGSWFEKYEAFQNQWRPGYAHEQMLTLEDVIMVAEGRRFLRARDLEAGSSFTASKITIPGINDAGDSYRENQRIYGYDIKEGGAAITDYEAFKTKIKTLFAGKTEGTDYWFGIDQVAATVYIKDEADNGNRPGVYIETKVPFYFPNVEKDLHDALKALKWYGNDLKPIATQEGKVAVGNSKARIVLQTFSKESLMKLSGKNGMFTNPLIPVAFLFTGIDPTKYANDINFAIENGATIIAPNIDYVAGYPSSILPWQGKMIRKTGMHIHAWSFNTNDQYARYTGATIRPLSNENNYMDMTFTNLSDLAVNFYRGLGANSPILLHNPQSGFPADLHTTKGATNAMQVLEDLGYSK